MPRNTNVVQSQAASGRLNSDQRLTDFSGGRVNCPEVVQEAQVPYNMLIRSQNVDTSGGSLRKMRGFTKWWATTFPGDIDGIWYDIPTTDIYVASNGKLYSITQAQTRTERSAAVASNDPFMFTRLTDYVLAVSPNTNPITHNTATNVVANITTPPATWTAGNYPIGAVTWMGRVFAWQRDSDILHYSVLYDVMDWSPGTTAIDGGALRIGSDGASIKAVLPYNNGLIIFKDPGMYFLSGDATYSTANVEPEFDQRTFTWQLVTPDVDAVGARCAIAVGQNVYVWGKASVWRLSVTSNSYVPVKAENIGANILYDVKNCNNAQDYYCAVNYPERGQIWWSVAGSGASSIDTVHCYDYQNTDSDGIGAWMLRKGYSHKSMANVLLNNEYSILSGGYAATPYLYLQNSGLNWDATAMEYIAWSAWFPLGVAAQGKPVFISFFLGQATTGDIQYTYAYDFNTDFYDAYQISPDAPDSSWNSTGTSTWGSSLSGTTGTWTGGQPTIRKTRLFGKGRVLQHRFYNAQVDTDIDIITITHTNTTVGYA